MSAATVSAPVHYAPSGTPACLPNDPPAATRHRKATADPALADCRHCRETPAWQEAQLFAALDAYRAVNA